MINNVMKQYLYLKTHRKTGLKYLGKTSRDPYKYNGSGVRWTHHLNKHGVDLDTQVLAECDTNEEVAIIGAYYSKLWNIVESKDFANLKAETGDGGSYPHREETKIKMSAAKKGKPGHNKNKGKKRQPGSKAGDLNPMFGKFVVNNGIKNFVLNVGDDIPMGCIKGALQNNSNKKIRNAQNTGENNPNFKSYWITNGTENKMIKATSSIPQGWWKGRVLGSNDNVIGVRDSVLL